MHSRSISRSFVLSPELDPCLHLHRSRSTPQLHTYSSPHTHIHVRTNTPVTMASLRRRLQQQSKDGAAVKSTPGRSTRNSPQPTASPPIAASAATIVTSSSPSVKRCAQTVTSTSSPPPAAKKSRVEQQSTAAQSVQESKKEESTLGVLTPDEEEQQDADEEEEREDAEEEEQFDPSKVPDTPRTSPRYSVHLQRAIRAVSATTPERTTITDHSSTCALTSTVACVYHCAEYRGSEAFIASGSLRGHKGTRAKWASACRCKAIYAHHAYFTVIHSLCPALHQVDDDAPMEEVTAEPAHTVSCPICTHCPMVARTQM